MTPSEIERAARELITAEAVAMGVEVCTPIIYPNGDCVRVYVAREGDDFIIHDASLAEMYVVGEGMRVDRSARLRFSQATQRYDCAYVDGRVHVTALADEVPTSIMLVANASRAIADLAAEAKRQSESQFRYVLTERLREIVGPRLRENEPFKGMSGSSYRVANVIMNTQETAPIGFVVPLPSRSAVASQFRELFDLRAAFPDVFRDSVFNDGSDFRQEEDGWLLRQVGEVTPFSEVRSRIPALIG